MTKFRKKPVVVEAVQWNRDGDHSAVKVHYGQIIYSTDEKHFYVSHSAFRATEWFPIDPQAEGAAGSVLPFSFWEVKSGKRVSLNDLDSLSDLEKKMLRSALAYHKIDMEAIRPRAELCDYSQEVEPGDWIVSDEQGKTSVVKPDVFKENYEPVA